MTQESTFERAEAWTRPLDSVLRPLIPLYTISLHPPPRGAVPSLRRIAYAVAGCALVFSHAATAQPRAASVQIHGLVYDNLRKRPLSGAIVSLSGSDRQTTTDSRGRFRFDSVAPGDYTFAAHHATLDSLGFPGLTARTTVTDGAAEVRMAIPTFETLWRVACGRRSMPDDSAFVYGTIRDAVHLRPVANAKVRLTWMQTDLRSRSRALQRRWALDTQTDSTGSYSACGVAADEWLTVSAATDSSASGDISLAPTNLRLHRRDLLVGPTPAGAVRGTISGIVVDGAGMPVQQARISLDSLTDARTEMDGRFVLHAPVGTRQIQVAAIGELPAVAVVDVTSRDTAWISVQLSRAASLNGVKVVATSPGRILAMEYEARKRSGAGYVMDSTSIVKHRTLATAIGTIPSTTVRELTAQLEITMPREKGGRCRPTVWIDGVLAEYGHLVDLQPNEVAAFEVYPRPLTVPPRFTQAGQIPDCGAILVWTKYGFRNR